MKYLVNNFDIVNLDFVIVINYMWYLKLRYIIYVDVVNIFSGWKGEIIFEILIFLIKIIFNVRYLWNEWYSKMFENYI